MDDELFQILSLFLLLGLLLTLFGVLQSLGAIRKSLERDEPGAAQPAPAAAAPAIDAPVAAEPGAASGEESPLTWARPTEAESAASERSGWPSPQEAAEAPAARIEPEPEPEPQAQPDTAASRDAGARVLYGDRGLTSATPNEAALTPSAAEDPNANPFETTPEPRKEPEAQPAAAEDPQEQPFERDGRWWFRRGDELLVYEEQTGQWVAAGEPSTSGSVATSATSGAGSPAASGEGAGGESTAGQVTSQLEPAGSFWKCPSCGAVNGSTGTSCRMCFTARP